ncbi:TPA: hypothetical protein AB5A43_003367 [Vibrio cholerae]
MKKRYNHEEVMKLLDDMEACVNRMSNIRKNFEYAVDQSAKKVA